MKNQILFAQEKRFFDELQRDNSLSSSEGSAKVVHISDRTHLQQVYQHKLLKSYQMNEDLYL